MIKVLVVDDHHLVRAGICAMLESSPNIQILGEASCGDEAVALAKKLKHVDVAVLDVEMPGMPIIELVRSLQALEPPIPSVILTSSHEESLTTQLLQEGVKAYVTKLCGNEHLLAAIEKTAHGEHYLSPDIAKQVAYQVLTQKNENISFDKLSERERECLELIAQGKNSKEIAKLLKIHAKTISTYRHRIFEKLGISSDIELVKLIARHPLKDKES
ncbi:MAG: gacA [Gammaproteobacteria bacterium]|nr:gacA [Gammaproteobacteria bacterium]